jgi:hypothetical protein
VFAGTLLLQSLHRVLGYFREETRSAVFGTGGQTRAPGANCGARHRENSGALFLANGGCDCERKVSVFRAACIT